MQKISATELKAMLGRSKVVMLLAKITNKFV
jgi:hypothetical protein